MYQFNGWLEILDDAEEPDGHAISAIADKVVTMIQGFEWSNGYGGLRVCNGSYFLSLTGASNRPRTFPEDLRLLVNYMASNAPGSYGLIHWRDDEHPHPAVRKNFQVIALRRGAITNVLDDLLSPIVPTIEL